jgi:hypothetical protein
LSHDLFSHYRKNRSLEVGQGVHWILRGGTDRQTEKERMTEEEGRTEGKDIPHLLDIEVTETP